MKPALLYLTLAVVGCAHGSLIQPQIPTVTIDGYLNPKSKDCAHPFPDRKRSKLEELPDGTFKVEIVFICLPSA